MRELEIVYNTKMTDGQSGFVNRKEAFFPVVCSCLQQPRSLFANVYGESNKLGPFINKSPDFSIFQTVKIQ